MVSEATVERSFSDMKLSFFILNSISLGGSFAKKVEPGTKATPPPLLDKTLSV